ncbi:MAG: putative zinc-binding metallopeptidase [Cyanobacteriota bacterium]
MNSVQHLSFKKSSYSKPTALKNNRLMGINAFYGHPKSDFVSFKASTISQLTNELRAYNFTPDIGDNKDLAEITLDCIKDVEAKGFKIPKNHDVCLIINNDSPLALYADIDRFYGCLQACNYNYIPVISKIFPPKISGKLFLNTDLMNLDSNERKRDIYHEIGHFLHMMTSPNKYKYLAVKATHGSGNQLYEQLKAIHLLENNSKLIEQYVSKYACSKPNEFVAEVFAELMLGNSFDKEGKIVALYRKLGGPMPKA